MGALTTLGFIWAVARHDANGAFGQNTAAWVQAIGSIAAVVGASAIAFHQSWEQRRAADLAAKAKAAEQTTEISTFLDAAHNVLSRVEVCSANCAEAVEKLDLEQWGSVLGVYQSWTTASAIFAADFRLLATRAPHGWLVAEFVRCAAVVHLAPIPDLRCAPEILDMVKALISSPGQAVPGLRRDLESLRKLFP